ncbi:hypothetical protein EZJ49_07520 [Bdellovibrio bacteriovorus]|uniref:hypothetical protein n=1 Tax=Bdellovibrio bacteriovorus TaxID=959 RepID=UPI0021CF5005|nr:hypothetical protein [Bdellovibrio bacteriovorus]UXR66097.1 hypothetical protein EZJ49_07520 [Bdellovibrio bacteriovorus]
MIYKQFSEKLLITCVTFFALNAFALDSGPADLKITNLPKLTSDAGRVETKDLIQPDRILILDNAQLKGIKDFQTFLKTQGPRTGGGGNSCALSIHQNTEKLVSLILEMPKLLSEGQREALLYKISVAKFYLSESLSLDGQLKDAINYPDANEIFVSSKLCGLDLLEVQSRAMAILLHEYLGLARIDDRQYQISGAFLQNYAAFNARGYTFTSDNSYYVQTGQCIQSVLQIHQIGNNLIVSSSANPGARILALTREQVDAFKALDEREWGPEKKVKIADKAAGVEYVFSSETCSGTKCDFLTIQNEKGKLKRFKNSIHGLAVIGCKR